MTTPTTTKAATMERRFIRAKEIRLLREAGKPVKVHGHAAVFGELSEDLGGFREMIQAGAFADAIERDDVRALWNHDSSQVLGRNLAGTLRMAEDKVGLAIEIDLPDTQAGRDAAVSIERGDVTQMSFGFQILDWSKDQVWQNDDDGNLVRTILRASLFDVSPVTYPAYPQTDIAMRSLERAKAEGLIPTETSKETPAEPPPSDELHGLPDADLIHRHEALGMTL